MHQLTCKSTGLFALALAAAGCTAPAPWVDYPAHRSWRDDATESLGAQVAVEAIPATQQSDGDAAKPVTSSPAANPAEQASVLDELEEVRDTDPILYQRLKEDLRETDPSLWPLLAKTIRATLAYRQQQTGLPASAPRADAPATGSEPVLSAPHPLLSVAAAHMDDGTEPVADDTPPTELPALRARTAENVSNEVTVSPGIASTDHSLTTESPEAATRDHKTLAVSDVDVASHAPGHWTDSVGQAIHQLEALTAQDPGDEIEQARLQTYLRLLYLAADRRDDAVRPIKGIDQMQSEFWSHLSHGLATYLDKDGTPVDSRRAALALRQLRQANDRLSATSTLDVRNLAFCTRVDSFGRYEQFNPISFAPDQEVLLYVEVDNFHVEEGPSGFSTRLQGSYQIFDSAGRRVADHSFQLEEETCRNRRRDYFIAYRMWLPKTIYPGEYTLQLTIEDVAGRKFGQSTIDFTIK